MLSDLVGVLVGLPGATPAEGDSDGVADNLASLGRSVGVVGKRPALGDSVPIIVF